ncbi:sporulation protein YqfD [Bacillus sp. JCM 19041]|uniref:sporulation protein YqfD n=1 Tax=Bacillus sp. JCM 19041 TaxID=1460637 RepID=UPI0006CF48F6
MFVEDGKAVKRTNDLVEKGDMLVSGFIGAEGKEQTVAAKASIIGEIWYTSSVTLPYENEFTTITGEQKNKRLIQIGNWDIPFWNFSKPDYETYEIFERETNFSIFGYRLPVQIRTVEQRETFGFSRTYTKDEAVEVAKKHAREELRGKLPDDAEIKTEHILQEHVENDTVSLKIHYQVLEEIAQEKPIIQGD